MSRKSKEESDESGREEKAAKWRRRNLKGAGRQVGGRGTGGTTRDLVTTVNFTLGKKSRGRVVRPISRGLLSNKLVSERMAAAAAADIPARGEGGRVARVRGGQRRRGRRGRSGHKWRTVAGARGISCQMILIGSCRAIQRRPKKAKKSSGGVKQAQKKNGKRQKKRDRERERKRENFAPRARARGTK